MSSNYVTPERVLKLSVSPANPKSPRYRIAIRFLSLTEEYAIFCLRLQLGKIGYSKGRNLVEKNPKNQRAYSRSDRALLEVPTRRLRGTYEGNVLTKDWDKNGATSAPNRVK